MTLEVIRIRTQDELREALSIRRRVFIEEQAVDEAIEIDHHDGDPTVVTTCLHVLLLVDSTPVATGRLLLERDAAGHAHIGRVAVLPQHRGRGYGAVVMQELHDLAREQGISGITLAAQLHAIGFYESLGYVARGDVFQDANIDHRWMDLRFL